MEQKRVIQQDAEYICNIDITVEEWKTILTDETLMYHTYRDVLINFYNEPEYKSTCKALGKKYDKSPQHFNSIITHFAKSVQKRLNHFEVFGTNGKPTYWIIPMKGKYVGKYFEWTLRPELVQAIEELLARADL